MVGAGKAVPGLREHGVLPGDLQLVVGGKIDVGRTGRILQADGRGLAARKVITFEFSTCMSPNAEWGSSQRLFQRYLEMVGLEAVCPDAKGEVHDE